MRKILSLLTLLLCVCSGTWAQTTEDILLYGSSVAPILPVKQGDVTISGVNTASKNGSNQGSEIGIPSTKIYMVSLSSNGMLTIDVGEENTISSIILYVGLNTSGSAVKQFGHGGFSTDNSQWSEITALSAAGYDYGSKIEITPTAKEYRYYSFGRGNLGNTKPTSNSECRVFQISVTIVPIGSNISASDATITATESGVEVTEDIAVTGSMLEGKTLTATLSPAVEGLTVTLANNTIVEGAIETTATLHYNATENASGMTTLTLSDGTTYKNVTVTYKAKFTEYSELQTISDATTWDFSKGISGSKQFTSEEEKNTEYVYADIEGLTFTKEFNAEALAFKGEYPLREGKTFAQNGVLRFNTAVPGTIKVKFSDTGSSASNTAVKRYLVVNEQQTEYWTSRENNGDEPYEAKLDVVTDEIEVSAGDVTIKGTSAITVSYIIFTPSATYLPETTIVSSTGYASFSSNKALDFTGSGLAAYVISEITEESATLTQVTKVPAETGLILLGEQNKTYTVNILASNEATDDFDNLLEAVLENTPVEKDAAYVVYEGELHPFAGGIISAGKAYLPKDAVPSNARALSFTFGETTGINTIQTNNEAKNNVFYNLAGQRIAQPTKGLYIVNGKKVVIK
ncbi:MAG: hypothetical protein J1E37_04770 [Prevotella sp.]|nr:hypothetical protein [Prevotella sp.]